jgi:hypothetical protein
MITSWLVLAVVFSACVAFFLVTPYFDHALAGSSSDSPLSSKPSLSDGKERALRALKDLELDQSMGKISDEDFTRAKQELTRELAGILEEVRGRA